MWEMENLTIYPEKDAYVRALDRFKVAKRALNECDLRIEVARMTKDMVLVAMILLSNIKYQRERFVI